MGLNGAQMQDSRHQSDNSKDSDFSHHEEGSNAVYVDDEFADNYFDDDRSWAGMRFFAREPEIEGRQLPEDGQFVCGI